MRGGSALVLLLCAEVHLGGRSGAGWESSDGADCDVGGYNDGGDGRGVSWAVGNIGGAGDDGADSGGIDGCRCQWLGGVAGGSGGYEDGRTGGSGGRIDRVRCGGETSCILGSAEREVRVRGCHAGVPLRFAVHGILGGGRAGEGG